MTFRFKFPDVKMQAAEEDFEAGGHHFRAGAFIIANADRAKLEPVLKALGLSGWAMADARRSRRTIWTFRASAMCTAGRNTQNEGWVRAALDTYGVPYTYFARSEAPRGESPREVRRDRLSPCGRQRAGQVNGIPKGAGAPLPYRKTDATPNLGALDQSDDIRGGMGLEGSMELYKFVQEGGTLITEGIDRDDLPGVQPDQRRHGRNPAELFARGSILRGMITDPRSPLVYGYDGTQLPVYFSQSPVLTVGGGGGRASADRRRSATPGWARTPRRWPPRSALPLGSPSVPARASGSGGWAGRAAVALAVGAAAVAEPVASAAKPAGERPRVVHSVPRESPTRCCSRAPWRAVRRWPAGPSSWTPARHGPRGDVRHPALLAVADPGHLSSWASTRF